ncbi:MAG: carbohydrate-binding protein [Clostridia bacterium]|nr:carbohydrate-binding protein [Clostridia bacterium]
MISITVQSSEGTVLAYAEHPEEAWLSVDRAYLPGDVIRITGSSRLRVRMDQALPAGEVFLPSGVMTWPVPAGEHRLAYAPGTFEAPRHIIFAAAVPDSGLHRIRNLALNPADLRGDTDFYPHCTANVETRNEACFCARNVIDGLRLNSFHGEWPFQSWGIGAREDAWCELDFGRPVIAEKMALTLRADFPHDAYWTAGHVVLSDGTDLSFSLRKTADRQWIDLGDRIVSRLRLEKLIKSNDPSAFPALRQWEVFGREHA